MEAFRKEWLVAWLRAVLVLLAAAGVRQSLRWAEAQHGRAVTLAEARLVFPEAGLVGLREPGAGMQEVRDGNGVVLGKVLLTQPDQREVKGYAGPTQVVAGMGMDGRLAAWEILASADTEEHVAQVRSDAAFRGHLDGWQRGADVPDVAVAGSTLTSQAIRESLLRRLGGVAEGKSVRFPEPVTLEEVRALFPAAALLEDWGNGWRVLDGTGEILGEVLRSAPWADGVRGYQGATEVLIGLDAAGQTVVGVKMRRSEDNEPYVGYVREDTGWLEAFRGKTVKEVAAMDFAQAGIEGVSGATLTSFAVAESVRLRCAEAGKATRGDAGKGAVRALPLADLALGLVALGGVGMSFSGWRGRRWLRRTWQVVLVLVPGVWLGSLLALPLFEGWMRHGVGWRVMPGMVLLAAVALLMPVATGRQVYCHQICPHGALQEWLGGRLRTRAVPARWDRWLRRVPGLLLVLAFLSVALSWGWPLADFEAFDAWVPRVAGVASWVLAVLGLGAALVIPQAYCRYGCPTGALLRFLRRSGGRGWGWSDAMAVACAAAAWFPWLRLQAGWDRPAAAGESAPHRLSGTAFGTNWSLQLRSPVPDGLRSQLEAELERVDHGISAWRSDSVLSAFHGSGAGQEFPVPAWIAELAREARHLSEVSSGAFDATIGPIVAAWGFGAGARKGREPEALERDALRARCGWWKVEAGPGFLRRDDPVVRLDLTPLGEGAALDAMASVLDKSVSGPWLLSLGGELRARGRWNVRIESTGHATVLTDAALSTSGTSRARHGQRSHLIDARNGRPVAHDTVSVTVRHASSSHADGWATALAVLGTSDGVALADRVGIAALFVRETADGPVVEVSEAWDNAPRITRSAP
jgi:thiamine biosynthesis lipoprotein ApbE